jgi:urease accessory protein
MLTFNELTNTAGKPDHRVSLTFHQRTKGRLRINTDEGVDAGISIERGQTLENGQLLQSQEGSILEVLAKPEDVSVASTDSAALFARACYHVGNRHAEVQIGDNKLIYLRDHVMDEMLRLIGLSVSEQQLPFQPENGAYAGGHGHSHAHHDDEHEHHDHESHDHHEH